MKTLSIEIPDKNYDIIIENGLFNKFGSEIREIYKGSKITVVTDKNLYDLYGTALKDILSKENYVPDFIVVKPGESSKTIETLEHVYSKLALFNITRSDLIIAFGGGVVGDLAGFAAATYLRGISYIQIPTSLLAQIDSSIGGKTAINLKEGKNLAGSFCQPLKVLIDPEILFSLPQKYINDGLGEVIKYACIKDYNLFSFLMSIDAKNELFNNIEKVVFECCNIKKQLVEKDEKDAGERMLLNFGHTIGHAIEKHMNYQVSHGEAVSAGMLHITKNSEYLGYTEVGTYEKIKNLLNNFNIDDHSNLINQDIIKYVCLDKKNLSGEINLILLKKIGYAFIHKVSINDAEKFIN